MAKHKKPKPYHLTYEDTPLCDCGAMHSTGGIDDWAALRVAINRKTKTRDMTMNSDYARGRADALREAMIIAATYIDWTGPGWDGAAKHIHDDIEALAQQPQPEPENNLMAAWKAMPSIKPTPWPEPKRECGTCKHHKNFAILRHECSEPCLSCFGYDKYEAEAGA